MKINLNISKLWFSLLLLGIGGFFLTFIFPHPQGFYAFAAVAAVGGFAVSANVYRVKRSDDKLICPMGSDCNAVITSRYSKFLGVPLEILGMMYFAIVFLTYLSVSFYPGLLTGTFLTAAMALSAAAFLFSTYLLFVQAFLLRQWCVWCILAAAFSYSIFLASLTNLDMASQFLIRAENVLAALQSLGFALGIGSATAAIFVFYRFLKDLDIDEKEMDTLKGISEVAWVGLSFVLLSQLSLYVAQPQILADSNLFVSRIIALFAAAFFGAVLMVILAPFLAYIPFGEKPGKHHVSLLEELRKPTFAAGALTISSWYFAFSTAFLPEYPLGSLLVFYACFATAAVILSLAWEQTIAAKSLHK